MAKRDTAAIVNDLARVARGPKGWLKKPRALLDLFTEAGACRGKGVPAALMKAIETVEHHLPSVPMHQRSTVRAALCGGLSGLVTHSQASKAFVLERLHTEHGALPACYILFATSPTLAYDRLVPFFAPEKQPVPHPLLDHALRLLLRGRGALRHVSGAPKDPGWVTAEPRWTEVCMDLVALLHGPRDPAWDTTPFVAIDVLALAGTPEADHALIDLVGVVSVHTSWQAWSEVTHHRDALAAALRAERGRLLASEGEPVGDPDGPDPHPVFVVDLLLSRL